MFILPKTTKIASSREQIKIKSVSHNVLLLSDNKYRAILEINPINFELKSEDEQDHIIDNYQAFLNALPCSIQILYRIRAIDLDRYLDELNKKTKNQQNLNQKTHLTNYSQFIKNLVVDNKILSRSFYLVLPLNDTEVEDIELIAQQLKLLEDIVIKGLEKIGIKAKRLTNLEILDLFYSFYNPERSKIQSISSQTLELLSKAYL
jgi:hypothetical protein